MLRSSKVKETLTYGKKGVKALLMQQGLHKTLQGKSSKSTGMSDENWEEMDLKAASTIRLCITDEVMYNVKDEETATWIWSRLETYITKNLSNKWYLKKQLYGLRMNEGIAVLEHLNFFNKVISEWSYTYIALFISTFLHLSYNKSAIHLILIFNSCRIWLIKGEKKIQNKY